MRDDLQRLRDADQIAVYSASSSQKLELAQNSLELLQFGGR